MLLEQDVQASDIVVACLQLRAQELDLVAQSLDQGGVILSTRLSTLSTCSLGYTASLMSECQPPLRASTRVRVGDSTYFCRKSWWREIRRVSGQPR